MSRIAFMNTEIDNLTMEEAIQEVERLIIQKNKYSFVVTPNVDHIVKLEKKDELYNAYKEADLILADGKPLIWISKLYRNPIKEKISGSDFLPEICKMAAKSGYKIFLLGAKEGVAAIAANKLKQKFPGLIISGTYSPPFGFEKNESEIKKIIKMVREAEPDILIVGLGCPKQELFIYHYKDKLKVPISLGLGASIDFEAGNVKRAPKWMSKHGLEWFYRLIKEPKRMAKRYLIDDMKIIKLTWKYRKGK